MAKFPYTNVTGKLPAFLDHIRKVKVPDKATQKWLRTIGYTSSNHRTFVKILKYLGFAQQDGATTERWRKFRGKKHKKVLAKAIRESYRELYDVHPEAHRVSREKLIHFFRENSESGAQVVKRIVRTFQVLCEEASFEDFQEAPAETQQAEASAKKPAESARSQEATQGFQGTAPEIHIDVQVHISPDCSADQIDQIFQSMAKHLYHEED